MKLKKKIIPVVKPLAVYRHVKPERERRSGTGLINASRIKNLVLNLSQELRAGKIRRVSRQFLSDCNRHIEEYVRTRVKTRMGKGVTL